MTRGEGGQKVKKLRDIFYELSLFFFSDLSLMKLFGCAFYEICQMSMKSEQGKYVSAMGYHDRYEANVNAETIGSDEIW